MFRVPAKAVNPYLRIPAAVALLLAGAHATAQITGDVLDNRDTEDPLTGSDVGQISVTDTPGFPTTADPGPPPVSQVDMTVTVDSLDTGLIGVTDVRFEFTREYTTLIEVSGGVPEPTPPLPPIPGRSGFVAPAGWSVDVFSTSFSADAPLNPNLLERSYFDVTQATFSVDEINGAIPLGDALAGFRWQRNDFAGDAAWDVASDGVGFLGFTDGDFTLIEETEAIEEEERTSVDVWFGSVQAPAGLLLAQTDFVFSASPLTSQAVAAIQSDPLVDPRVPAGIAAFEDPALESPFEPDRPVVDAEQMLRDAFAAALVDLQSQTSDTLLDTLVGPTTTGPNDYPADERYREVILDSSIDATTILRTTFEITITAIDEVTFHELNLVASHAAAGEAAVPIDATPPLALLLGALVLVGLAWLSFPQQL